jgi:hypothetical protein
MITLAFFNQLLTNIEEAMITVNKPEIKALLGDRTLNTLTAALNAYHLDTQEKRDITLEAEAEDTAALEDEFDDQGRLASEAAFAEPYIDPSGSLEDIAEKEREIRGGGHCPDCGGPLCYGCSSDVETEEAQEINGAYYL